MRVRGWSLGSTVPCCVCVCAFLGLHVSLLDAVCCCLGKIGVTSSNSFRQLVALRSKPLPDFHITTLPTRKTVKPMRHSTPCLLLMSVRRCCCNVIHCIVFLMVTARAAAGLAELWDAPFSAPGICLLTDICGLPSH